jgi:hypothetical protein
MAKIKAVFYLPLRDIDGRDLRSSIRQLRSKVYRRFDGYTHLGTVQGAYRMPDGSRAIDKCAAYMVALEENRVEELEALLKEFRSSTQQDSIYLEVCRDVDVRFVR